MAKAAKETTFITSTGGTGFAYAIRKNKKKTKGDAKVVTKKYDPILRKHVSFEEKTKQSKLKKKAAKAETAK